jgi:hypothetical protein
MVRGAASKCYAEALRRNANFHLVDVAPFPIFTRFERLHYWVVRDVIMFGGMLIFRAVAATDVSAAQAEP